MRDDVISVAAQSINLNGATIVDAVGGGNAVLTITAVLLVQQQEQSR